MAGGLSLSAGAAAAASPVAESSAAVPMTFTLHGSGLRSSTPRKARSVGDSYLITGALSSRPDSAPDGELFATATVVTRTQVEHSSATTLQLHTFVLPSGTLTGSGVLTSAGAGDFPVTGGTGAYHGAQGSYSVRQDTDSPDGGSATYSFSLLSRKVASDVR